jgi:hypothetical protein
MMPTDLVQCNRILLALLFSNIFPHERVEIYVNLIPFDKGIVILIALDPADTHHT